MDPEQGVSLLILKPEIESCHPVVKGTILALVRALTSKTRLREHTLQMNFEQAKAIWGESVNTYSWAEEYYRFMASKPIAAFILKGKRTAEELKQTIRERLSAYIEILNEQLEIDFTPDLVHGSDPGNGEQEIAVLNITTESHG